MTENNQAIKLLEEIEKLTYFQFPFSSGIGFDNTEKITKLNEIIRKIRIKNSKALSLLKPKPCGTCGGTGQVGEEESYLGRSMGWKACPDCQPVNTEAIKLLEERALPLIEKGKSIYEELRARERTPDSYEQLIFDACFNLDQALSLLRSEPCKTCGGTGKILIGGHIHAPTEEIPCPKCQQESKPELKCPNCGKTGQAATLPHSCQQPAEPQGEGGAEELTGKEQIEDADIVIDLSGGKLLIQKLRQRTESLQQKSKELEEQVKDLLLTREQKPHPKNCECIFCSVTYKVQKAKIAELEQQLKIKQEKIESLDDICEAREQKRKEAIEKIQQLEQQLTEKKTLIKKKNKKIQELQELVDMDSRNLREKFGVPDQKG